MRPARAGDELRVVRPAEDGQVAHEVHVESNAGEVQGGSREELLVEGPDAERVTVECEAGTGDGQLARLGTRRADEESVAGDGDGSPEAARCSTESP